MSIITIQIGQCGNQLGPAFFHILSNELYKNSHFYNQMPWNLFFYNLPSQPLPIARYQQFTFIIFLNTQNTIRSILIDMEPSVVKSAVLNQYKIYSKFKYDEQSSIIDHSGSGNNWATGYNYYGPRYHSKILAKIRRQMEMCDYFGGFLIMHSMAGGTGSGLGSYTTEILKNEYNKYYIMNNSVWPYSDGEVVVQSYNSLLTLNKLNENSNGIFVNENNNSKVKSYTKMNMEISRNLASILLPCKIKQLNGDGRWMRMVGDFISHMCNNENQKLLSSMLVCSDDVECFNSKLSKWDKILKIAKKSIFDTENYVILRGKIEDDKFKDVMSSVGNNVRFGHSPERFNKYDQCLSIVSNSKKSIVPIIEARDCAVKMLKSKAFLHRYEEYGIGRDYILNCVKNANDIIVQYKTDKFNKFN